MKEYPNPDSFGLFDLADGLAGMGFVACQGFLTSTYGWYKVDKPSALKLDPRYPSGLTIFQASELIEKYMPSDQSLLAELNPKKKKAGVEIHAGGEEALQIIRIFSFCRACACSARVRSGWT